METTMPRSALRHRMISSDRTLPPVAVRASRKQAEPEPEHAAYAMPVSDQAPDWPWFFCAGMVITLVILLFGHLIGLPAL